MTISSVTSGLLPNTYAGGQAASASSAPTVALSPDAQGYAALNAAGVTVALVPYSGGPPNGHLLTVPQVGGGSLSQTDFENVLEGLGATAQQATQSFTAADTDQNGWISNSELLKALSSTSSGSTTSSQELLKLMDANHDDSVSGSEYLSVETALVQNETAAV